MTTRRGRGATVRIERTTDGGVRADADPFKVLVSVSLFVPIEIGTVVSSEPRAGVSEVRLDEISHVRQAEPEGEERAERRGGVE